MARPPTLAANGTVASITMLPGRIAGLSCLSRAAWPSKGMVSTSSSAAAQAARFSVAGNLCAGADALFDFFGCILGALGVSRSDDYGFAGLRPAQGQAESFGTGAAENRDGPGRVHEMAMMESFMRTRVQATARPSAPRAAA